MVDGLQVMTVSQVLDARAPGGLRSQSMAVGGYWSAMRVGILCAAPLGSTGQLEIYCYDGTFGVTELDEPIMIFDTGGTVTPARGPHLTPYLPNGLDGADRIYKLPWGDGRGHAPVPIVVVGHFDDPRAADCRPEARQLCLDRLVVDKIAYFTSDSAVAPEATGPTLAPSPSPTAFNGHVTIGTPSDQTVPEHVAGFSFERPANWVYWQPNQHAPYNDGPLIYLSTDPLNGDCAVAPDASPRAADTQGYACSWPLDTLGPDGVFVEVRTTRILVPVPSAGEPIHINGGLSGLQQEQPGQCAHIGAEETIWAMVAVGVSFGGPVVSNLETLGCLRGPDLIAVETQLRAFLASIIYAP